MKKAIFEYKKDDGSIKSRELIYPKFIKESYNSYDDFNKENVQYVQGYEIEKYNLTEEQIKMYEEALSDYFNLAIPKLDHFLSENGLDATKVKMKNFKKTNISNFNII